MQHSRLNNILADLRGALEALYGARLVELELYGSQARGDADAESDIDVLVVLRGEVDPFTEIERTGEIVAGISLKDDAVLSTYFVSEAHYTQESSAFLRTVRSEGVLL